MFGLKYLPIRTIESQSGILETCDELAKNNSDV